MCWSLKYIAGLALITKMGKLTLVGDVVSDGDTQRPEATQSKLCDLAANLIADLSSVVGVAKHDLQHEKCPDEDSHSPCNPPHNPSCDEGLLSIRALCWATAMS